MHAERDRDTPLEPRRSVSMFEPVRPFEPPPDDGPPRVSLFEPQPPSRPAFLFEPARHAGPPPSTPPGGHPAVPQSGGAPAETAAERTMHLPAATGPPPAQPPRQPEPEPTEHLEPEPTVHLAPDGPLPATAAETTNPIPRVPGAQPNQPDHLTVGLPLLDLLAPQQPQQPQQSGQFQHGGQYVPHGPYASEAQYAPDAQFVSAAGYGQGGYDQEYAQRRPAPPPRRPNGRLPMEGSTKLVIGLAAGVLLLVIIGVWALSSSPSDGDDQAGGRTRPTSPAQATSVVRTVEGYQFTQNAARTDADCAGNAYGDIVEFFRSTPCAALDRVLYLSTVDGRPAVVSLSLVRMPDEQKAIELQKLVDTSGTGNVNDLLKAGVQAPGGPPAFSDAGYASARDGAVVAIAEADFADPGVRDQAALDKLSTAALQLRK